VTGDGSIRRRGRRTGSPQTRYRILEVALDHFAERGFADTSIRGVAAACGVDPSLVTHFFSNKDGLFRASLGSLIDDLRPQMMAAISAGPDGLGARLAATYLGFWEEPTTARPLRAIYRSASANPVAAQLVQSQLVATMGPVVSESLPSAVADRFPLAMAALLGTAVSRYLFGTPGVATLPYDQLLDAVGAMLDTVLSSARGDDGRVMILE
jgi:AcrR family transcriptional regulator